ISRADEWVGGTGITVSYSLLPSASDPHLVYASFEDGLQVWLVNGSQIHGKWVPVKQDDLRRQVNGFGKQCADPTLSPDKAQALSPLVLQRVIETRPPPGRVAVELDEPLWGLTFEALRDGDGLYFADHHTVVYSPGLLAEATLRQPKPLRLQDPMLLVDAS